MLGRGSDTVSPRWRRITCSPDDDEMHELREVGGDTGDDVAFEEIDEGSPAAAVYGAEIRPGEDS